MKKRKGTALVHLSMLCGIVFVLYSYSMIHIRAAHPTSTDTLTTKPIVSVRDTITKLRNVHSSPQPTPGEDVRINARVDRKHIQEVKKVQKYDAYQPKCTTKFPDISESTYKDDIEKAAQLCIIQGYNNGKFYPNNHLLYGDWVQLIHKGYQVMQDTQAAVIVHDILNTVYEPSTPVTWERMKRILTILPIQDTETIQLPPTAQNEQAIVQRGEAIYILLSLLGKDHEQIDKIPIGPSMNQQTDRSDTPIQESTKNIKNRDLSSIVDMNSNDYTLSTTNKQTQENAIQSLSQIISLFSKDQTQAMMPVSRDMFLYGIVNYKQIQQKSIPDTYEGPTFFEDVLIDHEQYDHIAIAKIMGLTSGRETTQNNKVYLSPDTYVSVYEAKQRINMLQSFNIPVQTQDTQSIVTAYQIATRLTQDTDTPVIQKAENTIQAIEQDTMKEDPWLVEQMKPLVKQAVEMW